MTDGEGSNPQEVGSDVPPPPPPMGDAESSLNEGGVEVALLYSPRSSSVDTLQSPPQPSDDGVNTSRKRISSTKERPEDIKARNRSMDMIHQCRRVADWLNVKILLMTYASLSDNGNEELSAEGIKAIYSSAAQQIALHTKTFLSKPPSLTYDDGDSSEGSGEDDPSHDTVCTDPAWNFWRYVARQRWILFRLTRRYPPPPSLVGVTVELEGEEICHCTASWHYAYAGESLLKLGLAIRRERFRLFGANDDGEGLLEMGKSQNDREVENRQRFVGRLGGGELGAKFREECGYDHFAIALESLSHAVELMVEEKRQRQIQRQSLPKQKKSNYASITNENEPTALIAKLYFIMGGILKKQGRYGEAIVKLKAAFQASKQFPTMLYAIEMALVECWKGRAIPTSVPSSGGDSDDIEKEWRRRKRKEVVQSSVRMLFNPRIFPLMTVKEMDTVLWSAFSMEGGDDVVVVPWPYGSENSQPFFFTLTFPLQTYATEGDAVPTVLFLHSNLPMPIEITGIQVVTNLGAFQVPLAGRGESEIDSKMVLVPGKTVRLHAKMNLPNDVYKKTKPKVVESKPKSSGLTRLGGGCYQSSTPGAMSTASTNTNAASGVTSSDSLATLKIPEASQIKQQRDPRPIQLGGLSVCCSSLELSLTLPSSTEAGRASVGGKRIQLELQNHNRGSLPPPLEDKVSLAKGNDDVKNWIDEEDNYVNIAWSRPQIFPLANGPRCARILSPRSELEVTDLTFKQTNGRAMEGTVNRILLELKAGSNEECRDMRMSVSCSSSLLFRTSDGGKSVVKKTLEMTPHSSSSVASISGDKKLSSSRIPVVVQYNPSPLSPSLREVVTASQDVEDAKVSRGIPLNWRPYNNSSGKDGGWISVIDLLGKREVTHTYFDIYRPLKKGGNDDKDSNKADMCCQTNFVVTLSYRQILPNQAQKDAGHLVTQEYKGSVTWYPPLQSKTSILPGVRKTFPSGSRHPTNTLAGTSGSIAAGAAVDGDEVNVRCSLEATPVDGGGEYANHCLGVKIEEVLFEESHHGHEDDMKQFHRNQDDDTRSQKSVKSHRSHRTYDEKPKCEIQLVPGKERYNPLEQSSTLTDDNSKILFSPKPNDICHMLRYGSRFNVSFTTRPKLISRQANAGFSNATVIQYANARLGAIDLKWIPISIPITSDVICTSHHRSDNGYHKYHGPLPIPTLYPIRINGPLCYVESTPFQASRQIIPPIPKVSCPFEVRYRITNKTNMHQKIRIMLNESGSDILSAVSNSDSGVLVSGIIGGETNLGPMEVKEFNYLMLFTTAGRSTMPSLHVSSIRYGTWIVHGDSEESIFVTP